MRNGLRGGCSSRRRILMTCRGVLVRIAVMGGTFSCRLVLQVRLSARQALRWMKVCSARAASATVNHALLIPAKQRRLRTPGNQRRLATPGKQHRDEWCVRRFRTDLTGVCEGRKESKVAPHVTLRGRELKPDPSHGLNPHNPSNPLESRLLASKLLA